MSDQGTMPSLEAAKKKKMMMKKDPTSNSRPSYSRRRCRRSIREEPRDDDDTEEKQQVQDDIHKDEETSSVDDGDDDDDIQREVGLKQAGSQQKEEEERMTPAPCLASLSCATDDFELFHLASDAAKHQVQSWTRAVLREVALQSLRTSMQIVIQKSAAAATKDATIDNKHNDNNNNNEKTSRNVIPIITLGESDIEHAASCCRLVAKKWTEQLQKVGHDLVGVWMDQVVQAEIDTLFYHHPNNSMTDVATPVSTTDATTTTTNRATTAAVSTNTAVAAKEPPNSGVVAAAAAADEGKEVEEATGAELEVAAPAAPVPAGGAVTVDQPTTPYARLRSLGAIDYYSWQNQALCETGVKDDDDDETRLDDAIREIDMLGRKGQTYWPYAWKYIEEAAAQIPQRLYNSNTNTAAQLQHMDDTRSNNQSQMQNSEQQQQQQQQEREDALEWLLVTRKRKSSGKRQLPPRKRTMLIQQQHQQQETQNDLLLPVIKRKQQRLMIIGDDNTNPRPATNDTGHFQWKIQEGYASFSKAEKKRLDACVHFDNPPEPQEAAAAAAEPPPSILLGSLCPVGQYHNSKQRWIDDNRGKNKAKKGRKSEQQQQMAVTTTMTANDNDLCRQNKEQKRQRRRQRNQQRAGMRQRLGDHCENTVNHGVGKRKRVSKILQTTASSSLSSPSPSMENTNNNSNQQQQQQQQQLVNPPPPPPEHWIDFDLGYCMLELVVDRTTGKRGLYAFESLEIMALDEED